MAVRLGFVSLRISAAEKDAVVVFYRQRIGMSIMAERTSSAAHVSESVFLGFEGQPQSAWLELQLGRQTSIGPYKHKRSDAYWKIGLALRDVDFATECLRNAGVSVSKASQFFDIGYLTHISDPARYTIELLQHDFDQHVRRIGPNDVKGDHPLGQSVGVGQITLRVTKLDETLRFYRDVLGMAYLSRQPVDEYGFVLHFLGTTSESPPDSDINAVANREWLWKRPYTQLELQHVPSMASITFPDLANEAGFVGIGFFAPADELAAVKRRLVDSGVPLCSEQCDTSVYGAAAFAVIDPEGVRVVFMEQP
ncbi:unnamed protein product [Vitrella brassicaformis CCMP3155]|uniref:VOC domain-containing protein n=1 Tax=Vitrella brassicaformis (strain CCMP3155) TaxID=1169540 RepID=A0A0G4EMY5_VITBC|nr:unnamed protein product [Vitrella brassicaformis CCMP3155]|mmetsp:Transcript_54200/g.136376  ORF Transcript_54200/g.136376 Transcript_54200/m.136376 type:complete len:309 (-) Transcript_54200:497-1423(-)|eukprot:CEL99187.1 unnamed protein product [Vitrella brassicaformis CCMP3155]